MGTHKVQSLGIRTWRYMGPGNLGLGFRVQGLGTDYTCNQLHTPKFPDMVLAGLV